MVTQITPQAEPIPGYTLLEPLGEGGFGVVWKARAPGDIPKAIKFVKGNLDDLGGRPAAAHELKALNRVRDVRHPFLLSMERVDIVDGQLIIVMELADRNLQHRLEECQARGLPGIPRDELLRYMEEAAEALDLMNIEYQLQHLDIKPANLFLIHSHVKVADFGLVKDLQGMTATITSGITPVYAAPETFEGRVSRFSDQYSFAIVFQELLTGKRPIEGKNARQLLMQHVRGTPNLTPLPEADRPIVERALSKQPDARFPTCGEFVRALRKASGPGAHSSLIVTPKVDETKRMVPAKQAPLPVEQSTSTRPVKKGDKPKYLGPTVSPHGLLSAKYAPPRSDPKMARKEDPPSSSNWRDVYMAPRPEASKPAPRAVGKSKRIKEVLQAAAKSVPDVPCPKCGALLIDPGPRGWCGTCGYETVADSQAGGQQVAVPAWTWPVLAALAGLLAVVGLVQVLKQYALDVEPGVVIGAGAVACLVGSGVLGGYFLATKKLKPRRGKRTQVRKLPPAP